MKGAGTASSPLPLPTGCQEAGTKPSPPLASRLHELALLAAWLGVNAALLSSGFAAQTKAPPPPSLMLVAAVAAGNAGATALEDEERAIDKQHLRQIYQAIQTYRLKHGTLPNWLSDLVPEFLPDSAVLMSPVELRTGRSVLWGYGDPKLKGSYIYEFSQIAAGGRRDQDIPLTMKQWKDLQMDEFGPVTPILRCHLHDPILNLSFSGEIYETGLFWETDTNTLALMARLGPGPGARDGRQLRLTVVDAATAQPLADVEVKASGRFERIWRPAPAPRLDRRQRPMPGQPRRQETQRREPEPWQSRLRQCATPIRRRGYSRRGDREAGNGGHHRRAYQG